jgi:hypothetical protein
MTDVLEGAWRDALAFLTELYTRLSAAGLEFARGLDPFVWWLVGGVLLLLLLLRLLLRRRDPARTGRPEVLLSLGTIRLSEGLDASGEVLLPQQQFLRATVSNLNTYAVQVLELALKTSEMAAPVSVEVTAVVPPEGSVVIEEPLPELAGEEGQLGLYFYAAGSRRLYRLQASFALEPWNSRYKISPLGQSVAPARQLPSAGAGRVQERAWQEDGELERTPSRAHRTPEAAPVRVVDAPRSPPEAGERGRQEGLFPDEF